VLKLLQNQWHLRQVLRQKFQRYGPVELHIFALVHNARPSAAENAQNAVVGNVLADQRSIPGRFGGVRLQLVYLVLDRNHEPVTAAGYGFDVYAFVGGMA
jgi:hypothetical protein